MEAFLISARLHEQNPYPNIIPVSQRGASQKVRGVPGHKASPVLSRLTGFEGNVPHHVRNPAPEADGMEMQEQ